MPDKKLGMPHRAALFALMAEAREVSNRELKERWNLVIVNPYRQDLNDQNLITSQRDGGNKPFRHKLTEQGWKWCADELTADLPARPGSAGSALYAVLSGLRRYLDREGLSLDTVFKPEAEPIDVEAQIRNAYYKLADKPKAWVSLADLRPLLGAAPRAEVDDALRRMDRTPQVTITPEPDRKSLTPTQRAAALRIGNEDNHLMAIGRA